MGLADQAVAVQAGQADREGPAVQAALADPVDPADPAALADPAVQADPVDLADLADPTALVGRVVVPVEAVRRRVRHGHRSHP